MSTNFMAVLETCEKCGKQYMIAHQDKKCPHPRIVDTPRFQKELRKRR